MDKVSGSKYTRRFRRRCTTNDTGQEECEYIFVLSPDSGVTLQDIMNRIPDSKNQPDQSVSLMLTYFRKTTSGSGVRTPDSVVLSKGFKYLLKRLKNVITVVGEIEWHQRLDEYFQRHAFESFCN
jgi:hypothetical protein